jgi:hypothetical protein
MDQTPDDMAHVQSALEVVPSISQFLREEETSIFQVAHTLDRFGRVATVSQV